MTEEDKVKLYMRSRVRPIKKIKYAAKFLSFESGIKMLQLNNIRFTQACELNDICDCDDSMIDFSQLNTLLHPDIDKIIAHCKNDWKGIRNWGICSLGLNFDNQTLWNRYASSSNKEDGICIVLDINQVIDDLVSRGHYIVAYPVEYIDRVEKSLPAELFYFGNKIDKMHFFSQLISTKNKVDPYTHQNWELEHEVRLISVIEQTKPELLALSTNCISKIYYGKHMSNENISFLKDLINSKYLNVKVIRHW